MAPRCRQGLPLFLPEECVQRQAARTLSPKNETSGSFSTCFLHHAPTYYCDASSEVLQGQSNDDSAMVASTTMVRGTSSMVSITSPVRSASSRGGAPWQAFFLHFGASRVELLRSCLGRLFPSRVVEDMLAVFSTFINKTV